MNESMSRILGHFSLDSAPVRCDAFGGGHVNKTFLVTTAGGQRYILQRINNFAFPKVDELMDNITRVTAHLRQKTDDPRAVMRIIPAVTGESYCQVDDGYWRVLVFAEGTLCLDRPESPRDFYESAVGFGTFQHLLSDFPVDSLHDTIVNFHNTPDRYRILREAIAADPMGRVKEVRREIDFALEREEKVSQLQRLRDGGELPSRVTHNDTKLNNVLMDSATRKALCVIDLDTVMAGLSVYDFGDAIRYGAATAAEDDPVWTNMGLDTEMYRVFTQGFAASCPSLTPLERELLPLGALVMTTECGVRFLTDYIKGDAYFSIARPTHNLDRARTQLQMAADMEKKWDVMNDINREVGGK